MKINYGMLMLLLVSSLYGMDRKEEANSLSQKEVEQCLGNSEAFAQLLFKKSCGSTSRLNKILKNTEINTGYVHFIYTHVNAFKKADPFRRLSAITVHSHPRTKITEKRYKLNEDIDNFIVLPVAFNLAKL